jgi:hypothetical protein
LANAELVGLPSLSEQAEAVSHAEGEEGLYGERQDIEILLCLLLIGVFTPARGNLSARIARNRQNRIRISVRRR